MIIKIRSFNSSLNTKMLSARNKQTSILHIFIILKSSPNFRIRKVRYPHRLISQKKDLMDILVSYFKTGLDHNKFCLWIISEP